MWAWWMSITCDGDMSPWFIRSSAPTSSQRGSWAEPEWLIPQWNLPFAFFSACCFSLFYLFICFCFFFFLLLRSFAPFITLVDRSNVRSLVFPGLSKSWRAFLEWCYSGVHDKLTMSSASISIGWLSYRWTWWWCFCQWWWCWWCW